MNEIHGPLIEDDVTESFLDFEFNDLNKKPLYRIRKMLLNDVEDWQLLHRKEQKNKLTELFKKILDFQNDSSYYQDFLNQEQSFFIDVISTPGFLNNPMVEKFVRKTLNKSISDKNTKIKYKFLLNIMDYYKEHDRSDIDKFNYILRSCDNITTDYLFKNSDISLSDFFDSRLLSHFDKDELVYLYKFNYKRIERFLDLKNANTLFVLSELYNKVKEVAGPNYEFLYSIRNIVEREDVVNLIESYYEWVKVNAKGNDFGDTISLDDNFGTSELIKFLISLSYDGEKTCCSDIVEFLNAADENRKICHEVILGKGAVEKVFYGVFDESDFPNISNLNSSYLEKFKSSFLEHVYGIDMDNASYIVEFYGKYLDEFYKDLPPKPEDISTEEWLNSLDESKLVFKKEDYVTLQILTSICNVYKLYVSDESIDEKLSVLQKTYLKNLNEKGILGNSKHVCFPILENALNKLYLNSFSKRLMQVSDSKKIIGEHNGVMLLDAGVEFDMIVTSIGAVKDIFDEDINMALRWNTASSSHSLGLSTSHISSQNMGVFTIGSPILGFVELDDISLNMMGTSDIYTQLATFFLKRFNKATLSKNRTFVPGSIMSDETRYGYNELLLDRFVNGDDDNNKLQPSYIVYYKFDDEYEKGSSRYKLW